MAKRVKAKTIWLPAWGLNNEGAVLAEKEAGEPLSAEDLAQYACNDCGVNIVTAGEYGYMLQPQIWNEQLGLAYSDNLCIGCLEARLGRRLSEEDVASLPRYSWMPPASARLLDRLDVKQIRPRARKRPSQIGRKKALLQ
jgi:hypothetical protein